MLWGGRSIVRGNMLFEIIGGDIELRVYLEEFHGDNITKYGST